MNSNHLSGNYKLERQISTWRRAFVLMVLQRPIKADMSMLALQTTLCCVVILTWNKFILNGPEVYATLWRTCSTNDLKSGLLNSKSMAFFLNPFHLSPTVYSAPNCHVLSYQYKLDKHIDKSFWNTLCKHFAILSCLWWVCMHVVQPVCYWIFLISSWTWGAG